MKLTTLNALLFSALLLTPALACTDDSGTDESTSDETVGETEESTDEESTDTTDESTEDTTDEESTEDTTEDTTDTTDETDTTEDTTDETDTVDETDTTEETGGGLSFEVDVYPILANNCSCHVGGGPGGLLMPDASTAYDNLVSVASSQQPNLNRVEPGDADSSYLVDKLAGTGSGGQMPAGGAPPLPMADQDLIADWINEGAAP